MRQEFLNVRDFYQFAAVTMPFPASHNDRLRFWKALSAFQVTPNNRAFATATFTYSEMNASAQSVSGCVSKMTKILRHVTGIRYARFVCTSRNESSFDIRVESSFVRELITVFSPSSSETPRFTGRRSAARRATVAATRPARAVTSPVVESNCDCASCRAAREDAMRESISVNVESLLNNFNPFMGVEAGILTTLMLESAR